jgi:hypothetical protein
MKEKQELDKYTLNDELNFIAWIASNGTTDCNGKIKNDSEVEEDGLPRKARTCSQRIDFLRKYAGSWSDRILPDGWEPKMRGMVTDYIFTIAIPTVSALREVQLGDLV